MRSLKSLSIVSICVLFAIGMFLFKKHFSKKNHYPKQNIVLKINDLKWTNREWLNFLFAQGWVPDINDFNEFSVLLNLSHKLINNIIHEEIIKTWAKKHNITISPSFFEKELSGLKKTFPNDPAFNKFLEKRNLTRKTWEKQIKVRLLGEKIMENLNQNLPRPTEEELIQYYQTHNFQFQSPEKALILQIFHKKKTRISAIKQLSEEGEDFYKLQKTFSTKSSRPQWIKKGDYPPFDQIFSLNLNQVSAVIKSPQGYHLIKVMEKHPYKHIPFEQAKEKITETLMAKRKTAHYIRWLSRQKNTVHVVKKPDFLSPYK